MEEAQNCCNPWKDGLQQPYGSWEEMTSLADDLNALSVVERNQLYDQIHGVAKPLEETPELVAKKIEELKQHLSRIPKTLKKDLERAYFLRPSLKDDNSFNLMFLRSKRFNAQEAAKGICAYFQHKCKIFGDELIVERITLKHLEEAEIQMIREGSIQYLSGRKSTGHVIQMNKTSLWKGYHWKSIARYSWYLFVCHFENDEENQKKGVVFITSWHGDVPGSTVFELLWNTQTISNHWPVCLNSAHTCYDSPAMNAVLKGARGLLPKQIRLREKLHFGSLVETQHALLTFGIDVHDCFEEGQGTLSLENGERFLREREKMDSEWRMKQSAGCVTGHIQHPSKYDVLMGRTAYVRDWPGNIVLSKRVNTAIPRFTAVPCNDSSYTKTIIAMDIVMSLREEFHTRFLERTDTGWTEVDNNGARTRVSRQIRLAASKL